MPNIRKGAEAKEIYLCGCHEKLFELASKYVTAKCRVELLACFRFASTHEIRVAV